MTGFWQGSEDGRPGWESLLANGICAMAGPGGGGARPAGGAASGGSSGELDDAALVALVQQGDTAAFRGLVERFQGRIYAHIYGMIRNREEARDLTQETFVKAFRNIAGFRGEASFTTWLYRISSNVTIDHIRKHGRFRVGEFDDAIGAGETADSRWEADHLRRSPGKDLERQRVYQRVLDAMQTLPPDQRQVVLLREIEGFSYREIAEAMDIPEGTVMSRLFYARKRLQALLGDLK